MRLYDWHGSANPNKKDHRGFRRAIPRTPFGIVPYEVWTADVGMIHTIAHERPPAFLGFWQRMYHNNVSPLMACKWNHDFASCTFTESDFLERLREHKLYRFTMEIAPRHGLGEIYPIEGFEP